MAHAEAERFRAFAAANTIKVPADFKWSREDATAREMSCCHEILSEDLNDGQIYRGMLAINPFKESNDL